MSEETQVVQADAPVVDQEVQQASVNTYDDLARAQGWKPKEEYEGAPDKWRSSKEFVERGELFGKIDTMGKELKETRKALKLLQEHHSKVKETEYNKAVTELKALQKRHLEEGNTDGFLQTSELLTDLKTEQKAREVVVQNTPPAPDARFTDWVAENKWYEKDMEMREYADVVGMGYSQKHPNLDPVEVLQYVTKQVKAQFKDTFVNPNRNKPNSVEGTNSPVGNKKDTFEMSDDERKAMNTFIRTGALTKEEFIADLKKMKGIKV